MAVSVMSMTGARSAGARKWWALAGLTLGVLAVGLDATVLSVALPTLAVSLHASATDLQWFVSSYTLGAGRGAAARRAAGGPVRAQEGHDDHPGHVRAQLAGLRLCDRAGGVHRRADGARAECGLHDPAGPVGDHGAVQRRGAAQGGGDLGGGQLPGPADRPDPGRLAAVQLLVGLGVPDEPAGGGGRPDRGGGAGARVPGRRAAGAGPGGDRGLVRRPGGAHLRVHRGRAVRLVLGDRDRRDGGRRGDPGGVRGVGAAAHPARRAATGGPRAVPVRPVHLGDGAAGARHLRDVRPAVRGAPVLPGHPGRVGDGQRGAAAAADGGPGARRRAGRPGGRAG